jgi:hypothetical protein
MASSKRATTKSSSAKRAPKSAVATPTAKRAAPERAAPERTAPGRAMAAPMPLVTPARAAAAAATPTAAAAPAAAATLRCPLPPVSVTHVVLFDDDVLVGDVIACEDGHLLRVTSLSPLKVVKS